MAFDTEYDLVVVGGGASGKSAALEAARAGKSVVILEKMPETGGLSMFAEGTAAFESSEQKKLGKPAHPDRHFPTKQEGYDKFNSYSHYRANFDVVRAFVDNSADTIDFLKDLGVEYKTVTIAAYDDPNEVWTFHLPDGLGARVQELLLSAVEHAGVDIFTETPATELIIEDGKVVGVVAESEGEPLRVGGKAVVLATGGMGSNPELIAKYSWFAPSAYNMNTLTPLQNMGDGLMMALSAGADDTNIVTCPILAAGARDKAMDSHIGAAGVQPGAIWINKTGRRFANEGTAENIGDIGPLYGKQPDGIVWSVLDQANIDRLAENGSEISIGEFVVFGRPLDRLRMELDQDVADGVAFAANTPEELAEKMGAENLVATVEKYNADVAAGEDTQFGRAADTMVALEEGPFYAVETVPYAYTGSTGGVRVDGNGQLLTEDGVSIEGLYLAGEILGPTCISGNVIFGGINHAMAATWGLNAAENAAKAVE